MAETATESSSYLWLVAAAILLLWWNWKRKKTSAPLVTPPSASAPATTSTTVEVETPAIVTRSYPDELPPVQTIPITSPDTPIPPGVAFTDPTANNGSSLTMAGYQYGDFSDAALANLSLQSQWFLARTQSANAYNGHPISLWEEWRINRGDGANGPAVGSQAAYKESVRATIAAAFTGYNGTADSAQYPVPDWFKSW